MYGTKDTQNINFLHRDSYAVCAVEAGRARAGGRGKWRATASLTAQRRK